MSHPPRKVSDVLSREEIAAFTTPSDLHGALAVATSWGLIGGAFALVARWPAWWSVLMATVILGGRLLGLSILMHEAAHRSLFRTRWLNDVVGKWLCAAPAWNHLAAYRVHHLSHHSFAGTDRDPDAGLVAPFPVSPGSVWRKFLRDLSGLSGLRRVYGQLAMDFGFIAYTASTGVKPLPQDGRSVFEVVSFGVRRLAPVALTNAVMFGVLYALGAGWVYALWPLSFLTTFGLFMRVRSMAEHACTGWTSDPFFNTRTTKANVLARLTVAPHHVNYHLEHHLLMTAPAFRLPKMHRLLRERGVFADSPYAPGYLDVLRTVSRLPVRGT